MLLDGKSYIWANASKMLLPPEARDFDLIRDLTHKEKITAFICTWTLDTVSNNIYVLPNQFTIHRRPIPQSSDVARARVGFSSGIHRWIVRYDSPHLGSHAGIGICTRNASLHGQGYYCVLGENCESWGWDMSAHELRHNGKNVGNLSNKVYV